MALVFLELLAARSISNCVNIGEGSLTLILRPLPRVLGSGILVHNSNVCLIN